MSNAISTDLTPQFNITTEDGIKFHGKYWSMSRRRGGNVDFIDPRSGELLIVTDEELAGLIGSSQARIVRAGATEKDEKFAAATMDLSVLRSADIEDGRRMFSYADEIRRRGLTFRAAEADVKEVINEVAKKIADPQPPKVYLVKRWAKRGVGRAAGAGRAEDELMVADLVPMHGFKGNRTSRVCFEVSKIIHERIDKVFLTRECRSVDTLVSMCRDKIRKFNENRDATDQLKLPGRKAVQAAIDSIDLNELTTLRMGADRAYDKFGPVEYRAPQTPSR